MPDSPSCEFQDQLTAFLPKMRVWAMALTRNRAAAEDLVQDVAMKALAASEFFVAGTNFSAWVHRIMTNHFISGVRGRRDTAISTKCRRWVSLLRSTTGPNCASLTSPSSACRENRKKPFV